MFRTRPDLMVLLVLLFLVGACNLGSPTMPPPVSPTPTDTPTGTPACDEASASVVLSTPRTDIKVGDPVKVTVTVNNEGCLALGLPQYRLYIEPRGGQLFTPSNPDPIVHELAVEPGQSDTAEFDLTASASGEASLTATVSYEVHVGYPGPAYWSMSTSKDPLVIHVAP